MRGCQLHSPVILIVDDEQGLVDVAAAYLEDLGYTTLTANNPKDALEVLEKHHQIDLLFSDVVMPGEMDGYYLAKKTMRLYPSIPRSPKNPKILG